MNTLHPQTTTRRLQQQLHDAVADEKWVATWDCVHLAGGTHGRGLPALFYTNQPVVDAPCHSGQVTAMEWTQDGEILASVGEDTKLCIWQVEAGPDAPMQLRLLETYSTGHRRPIRSVQWAGPPRDGKRYLVTAADDCEIRLIDRRLVQATDAHVKVADRGSEMRPLTWHHKDVDDGCCAHIKVHTGSVRQLVKTNNEGTSLLSCSEDGSVRRIDLEMSITRGRVALAMHDDCVTEIVRHNEPLFAIDVNASMPHLFAVAGSKGAVYVHDMRSLSAAQVERIWGISRRDQGAALSASTASSTTKRRASPFTFTEPSLTAACVRILKASNEVYEDHVVVKGPPAQRSLEHADDPSPAQRVVTRPKPIHSVAFNPHRPTQLSASYSTGNLYSFDIALTLPLVRRSVQTSRPAKRIRHCDADGDLDDASGMDIDDVHDSDSDADTSDSVVSDSDSFMTVDDAVPLSPKESPRRDSAVGAMRPAQSTAQPTTRGASQTSTHATSPDPTTGPSTGTSTGPSTGTSTGPSTSTSTGPSTGTSTGPSTSTSTGPSTSTSAGPSTGTSAASSGADSSASPPTTAPTIMAPTNSDPDTTAPTNTDASPPTTAPTNTGPSLLDARPNMPYPITPPLQTGRFGLPLPHERRPAFFGLGLGPLGGGPFGGGGTPDASVPGELSIAPIILATLPRSENAPTNGPQAQPFGIAIRFQFVSRSSDNANGAPSDPRSTSPPHASASPRNPSGSPNAPSDPHAPSPQEVEPSNGTPRRPSPVPRPNIFSLHNRFFHNNGEDQSSQPTQDHDTQSRPGAAPGPSLPRQLLQAIANNFSSAPSHNHDPLHGNHDDSDPSADSPDQRPGPFDNIPHIAPEVTFDGHINAEWVKRISFSLGGKVILLGSDDGNLFAWDAARGRVLGIWSLDDTSLTTIAPHPRLPVLAATGLDATIKIVAPTPSSGSHSSNGLHESRRRNDTEAVVQRNRQTNHKGVFSFNFLFKRILERITQFPLD